MRVTIDRAGRVVVPKVLREQLHLKPGAQLEATVHGGRLEITPVGPEVVLVEENGRLVATTGEPAPAMTHEELLEAIDQARLWPRRD